MDAGWLVDLQATERPGHASALAAQAVRAGSRLVFACGGDGTVNEVVNGLAGTGVALGVLRGGMGNVFAKEIGVPRNPGRALLAQIEGEERVCDLGLAGGRYFLLMAGIGLDASVVRMVPDDWKRRLGSTSYALYGLPQAFRYTQGQVTISLDGKSEEVSPFVWMLLANTRSYGGVLDVAGRATVDDGLLDAYVFRGAGPAWTLAMAARLLLRRHAEAQDVSFNRVSQAALETPGLPVQVDGEYLGETPMNFSVAAGALRVRLPKGKGTKLFAPAQTAETSPPLTR